MSKATCKTCGGEVPDGHRPSPFDLNGIGHPAHAMTDHTDTTPEGLRALYSMVRAGKDPDTGELHITEDEFVSAIEAHSLQERIDELRSLDDEHQTNSQDLERIKPGYTQVCVPAQPIWDRIKQLEKELEGL